MATDVFDAIEEQDARLDAILGSLSQEQWSAPSLCDGWSVRDVVLHLAQTDEAVVASIEERPAPIPVEVASNIDEAMEQWVRTERDTTPDVQARWNDARKAALEGLRNADPNQPLQWAAAPLKAKTLATTRLSEHWIHTLDIADPLGIDNPDSDNINHIAWLAWRTIPYAFMRAGRDDAPTVRAELIAPDGAHVTYGDADAACVVKGSMGEFCRITARRLSPEQATTIIAEGDNADDVLALIRTYA
ncbi:MAG: maleylpyruvate isomerase family mycothiol-dependent enzyme [Actinomycetota bacterium]